MYLFFWVGLAPISHHGAESTSYIMYSTSIAQGSSIRGVDRHLQESGNGNSPPLAGVPRHMILKAFTYMTPLRFLQDGGE